MDSNKNVILGEASEEEEDNEEVEEEADVGQSESSKNQSANLRIDIQKKQSPAPFSLLQRVLYAKNQQLCASLDHLYKHPLEKASKDVNTISQRLVHVQRTLHSIESSVLKLKREHKNLVSSSVLQLSYESNHTD